MFDVTCFPAFVGVSGRHFKRSVDNINFECEGGGGLHMLVYVGKWPSYVCTNLFGYELITINMVVVFCI